MYDLGDRLLMVACDRISTYDVVHPTPIPDKGKVLTGLSVFWFGLTERDRPQPPDLGDRRTCPTRQRGRALVVQKLEMLPVECVVRGYITGSGWKDYQATGSVSRDRAAGRAAGVRAAARSRSSRPARRPRSGHDEAIDFDQAAELVGDRELMERVRDVSLELYAFAAAHARARGVILADTKFEFGLDPSGRLVARRRGADAGLLALLAGRRLRARARAAELRQAVRARLGLGERLGQDSAGAGDPRRRRRRHARPLRRGLRADHRRAVPGVARSQQRREA